MKHIKKLTKIFCSLYKNDKQLLSKAQRKDLKRSRRKILKSFWRGERKKKGKKAREKNQNLSEEEKEKKRQYRCERNKDLSVEQKQKLVECMINNYLTHKKITV